MSIVLQCPVCSASFQVEPEQSGQLVACPTCDQTVAVPPDIASATPEPAPAQQEVFACPSCTGKFGVTPEMKGTDVACPHCNKHVAIGTTPKKATSRTDMFAPGHEPSENPLKIRTGKKKKKTVINIPGAASKPTPAAAEPNELLPPKIDQPKTKVKPPIPKPEIKSPAESKPAPKLPVKTPQVPVPQTTKSKDLEPPKPRSRKESKADSKTDPAAKIKQQPRTTSKPKPKSKPKPESESKAKPTPAPEHSTKIEDKAAAESEELTNPIDRRLPPKFTAVDPEEQFSATARGEQEHKVILPDGEGGYQRLDSRVVHVEREGRKVQLYSAPKEKKERKRFLQNLIGILIGIVILGAAFYFLVYWK